LGKRVGVGDGVIFQFQQWYGNTLLIGKKEGSQLEIKKAPQRQLAIRENLS